MANTGGAFPQKTMSFLVNEINQQIEKDILISAEVPICLFRVLEKDRRIFLNEQTKDLVCLNSHYTFGTEIRYYKIKDL